jgi:AcrR family transcriptional regulator
MGTQRDSEATRAKIKEAAGVLFALRGFHGVTVRDIAKKADTHLSALNYHFQSKDALYREVLMYACRSALVSLEKRTYFESLDPEEALFLYVKEAIKQYTKQTESNWELAIIDRECWYPSAVFEEVVDEYFKPEMDFISQIIGRIADKPAESHEIRFASIGLIGLLALFGYYNYYVDAIAPGLRKSFHKNDWLVRNIIRMVLRTAKGREAERSS